MTDAAAVAVCHATSAIGVGCPGNFGPPGGSNATAQEAIFVVGVADRAAIAEHADRPWACAGD